MVVMAPNIKSYPYPTYNLVMRKTLAWVIWFVLALYISLAIILPAVTKSPGFLLLEIELPPLEPLHFPA